LLEAIDISPDKTLLRNINLNIQTVIQEPNRRRSISIRAQRYDCNYPRGSISTLKYVRVSQMFFVFILLLLSGLISAVKFGHELLMR
jgi:hypothetical protein